jgi:hypothetical protein
VIHGLPESNSEVVNILKNYEPDSIVLELCGARREIFMREVFYKDKKQFSAMGKAKTLMGSKSEFATCMLYAKSMESTKRIELVEGDMDVYDVLNKKNEALEKCKCAVGGLAKRFFRFLFWHHVIWPINRLLGVKGDPIQLHDILHPSESKSNHEGQKKNMVCTLKVMEYERDLYIVESIIQKAVGNKIVVILGTAHLDNVSRFLEKYVNHMNNNKEITAPSSYFNREGQQFKSTEARDEYYRRRTEETEKIISEIQEEWSPSIPRCSTKSTPTKTKA